MPNLELSPEAVERLRLMEPLVCPRCRAQRGDRNYNLRIVARGASTRQTGVMVRCSIGHVALAVFVPLDGMVFHDIVPVDRPGGDGLPA